MNIVEETHCTVPHTKLVQLTPSESADPSLFHDAERQKPLHRLDNRFVFPDTLHISMPSGDKDLFIANILDNP